ncbi:unnamed protein product, partial [Cyprideis torosa]
CKVLVTQLKAKEEELRSQIKELHKELKVKETRMAEMAKELLKAANEKSEMEARLRSELDRLEAEKKELSDRLELAESEAKEISRLNDGLKAAVEDGEKLREELQKEKLKQSEELRQVRIESETRYQSIYEEKVRLESRVVEFEQELTKYKESVEEERHSFKAMLQESESEKEELREKVGELKKDVIKWEETAMERREQIRALSQERERLRSTLREFDVKMKEVLQQETVKSQRENELKAALDAALKEADLLTGQLRSACEELTLVKDELKKAKATEESLLKEVESLAQTDRELRREISEKEATVVELRAAFDIEKDDLKKQMEKLEAEREELIQRVVRITKELDDMERLKLEAEAKSATTTDLSKEEVEALRKEREEYETSLEELRVEYHEFQSTIESMKDELADKVSEVQRLQQEVDALAKKNSKLRCDLDLSRTEIVRVEETKNTLLAESQSALASAQTEAKTLRAELERGVQETERHWDAVLQEQRNQSDRVIDSLQEQVKQLDRDLSSEREQCVQLRKMADEQDSEIRQQLAIERQRSDSLAAEIEAKEAELATLREAVVAAEAIEGLKDENQKLREQVESLLKETDELKTNKEHVENEVRVLEDSLRNLGESRDAMTKEIHHLKQRLVDSDSEKNQLRSELESLKSGQVSVIEDTSKKMEELDLLRSKMEEVLKTKLEEAENVKKRREEEGKVVKELETELAKALSELESTLEEKQTMVHQYEEEIQRLNKEVARVVNERRQAVEAQEDLEEECATLRIKLEESNGEAENEIQVLRDQLSALHVSLEEEKNRTLASEEKVAVLDEVNRNLAALEEKVAHEDQEKKELHEQLVKVTSELERVQREEKEKLEGEVRRLQTELEEATNRANESSEAGTDVGMSEEVMKEVESFQQELNQLHTEQEKLIGELNNEKEKLKGLDEKNLQLQQEKVDLEARLSGVVEEREFWEAKAKEADEERDRLGKSVADLKTSTEQFERDMADLKHRLEQKEMEVSHYQNQELVSGGRESELRRVNEELERCQRSLSTKESDLKYLQTELSLISEREAVLAGNMHQLDEEIRSLRQQNDRLQSESKEKEARWSETDEGLRRELSQKQAECDRLRRELAEIQEAQRKWMEQLEHLGGPENVENLISERDRLAEDLTQAVEELRNVQVIGASKIRELVDAQDLLADAQNEVEDIRDRLENLQAELDEKKQEASSIPSLQGELDQMKRSMVAKEEEVGMLRSQMQELTAENQELVNSIALKATEVVNLETSLGGTIRSLESENSEVRMEMERFRAELSKSKAIVDEQLKQISSLEMTIADLKEEVRKAMKSPEKEGLLMAQKAAEVSVQEAEALKKQLREISQENDVLKQQIVEGTSGDMKRAFTAMESDNTRLKFEVENLKKELAQSRQSRSELLKQIDEMEIKVSLSRRAVEKSATKEELLMAKKAAEANAQEAETLRYRLRDVTNEVEQLRKLSTESSDMKRTLETIQGENSRLKFEMENLRIELAHSKSHAGDLMDQLSALERQATETIEKRDKTVADLEKVRSDLQKEISELKSSAAAAPIAATSSVSTMAAAPVAKSPPEAAGSSVSRGHAQELERRVRQLESERKRLVNEITESKRKLSEATGRIDLVEKEKSLLRAKIEGQLGFMMKKEREDWKREKSRLEREIADRDQKLQSLGGAGVEAPSRPTMVRPVLSAVPVPPRPPALGFEGHSDEKMKNLESRIEVLMKEKRNLESQLERVTEGGALRPSSVTPVTSSASGSGIAEYLLRIEELKHELKLAEEVKQELKTELNALRHEKAELETRLVETATNLSDAMSKLRNAEAAKRSLEHKLEQRNGSVDLKVAQKEAELTNAWEQKLEEAKDELMRREVSRIHEYYENVLKEKGRTICQLQDALAQHRTGGVLKKPSIGLSSGSQKSVTLMEGSDGGLDQLSAKLRDLQNSLVRNESAVKEAREKELIYQSSLADLNDKIRLLETEKLNLKTRMERERNMYQGEIAMYRRNVLEDLNGDMALEQLRRLHEEELSSQESRMKMEREAKIEELKRKAESKLMQMKRNLNAEKDAKITSLQADLSLAQEKERTQSQEMNRLRMEISQLRKLIGSVEREKAQNQLQRSDAPLASTASAPVAPPPPPAATLLQVPGTSSGSEGSGLSTDEVNAMIATHALQESQKKSLEELQRLLVQYKQDLEHREALLNESWERHLDSVSAGHSAEVNVLKREFEKTKRELDLVSELAMDAVNKGGSNLDLLRQKLVSKQHEIDALKKQHRNIVYQYMVGHSDATVLAKVIAALVRFTPDQEREVLEAEEKKQAKLSALFSHKPRVQRRRSVRPPTERRPSLPNPSLSPFASNRQSHSPELLPRPTLVPHYLFGLFHKKKPLNP